MISLTPCLFPTLAAAAEAAPVAAPTVLEPVLRWLVMLGIAAVSLCILGSIFRILRGPTLADRVLAGDAMALFVVALVILLAIILRTSVFMDAALVVAIIGFVSTLAFSKYLYATTGSPRPPKEPTP